MAAPVNKAVPAGVLRNGKGRILPMTGKHRCLWCGYDVTEGRDMAGATRPFDPCWQIGGDFGCDQSPAASDDGCGDHYTRWDAALHSLGLSYNSTQDEADEAVARENA